MLDIGKVLPRRTFLRGVGTALALPLLDGMIPAFASGASTAGRAVRRFGTIYIPNGMSQGGWIPAQDGVDFEYMPIMQALEPHRDDVLMLTGLANREADSKGEGSGDHARASAAFLSGVHPKKTEGAVEAAMSMDQIAARELGSETQLGSLEIGLDSNDLAGSCDIGWACAYTNTISWRTATTPLPMENNPRVVFERLFGDTGTTDPQVRQQRVREMRSILDAVTGKISRLRRELGVSDKQKLNEFLEAVRDVERRIEVTEEQGSREVESFDQPAGIPATFEEHARLMYELLALAYQTDLTRVASFMIGSELSGRSYPEIGVSESHHGISHHGGDAGKLQQLARINTLHVQLFAEFVERLRATPDGDGSLLDHVMLLYGGGLGNSDRHYHFELPILIVGGGAGQIRGGRHVRYRKDTPVTNLHLTLLNKMGIPYEKLGDSTGEFSELSGV